MAIAAGGILSWEFFRLGVSPRSPLGEYHRLDRRLRIVLGLRREDGLSPGTGQLPFVGARRVYQYDDPRRDTRFHRDVMFLAVNSADALVGVGAMCVPEHDRTRVFWFMHRHWRKLFGTKPSETNWRAERGRISGRWTDETDRFMIVLWLR